MKINQKKLKRQRIVIERWKANKARGTLQAVTGFGKTFVAILIIQDMNARKPERSTTVLVPTNYLKEQWEEKVKKFKLKNVSVQVINSAVKKPFKTDLLILDEIHNYASPTFKVVFKVIEYRFILGLTATMERADNMHLLLESKCPIIDTVDMTEALKNKYVSEFRVFNLGITMNDADAAEYKKIGNQFFRYFAMFGHDFNTAMKCLSDDAFRKRYSDQMGWDSKEGMVYAINFSRNLQKRKTFIYDAMSKIDTAIDIIKEFPDMKVMTFAERTQSAEQITNAIPNISVSYHSKMGKKAKNAAIKKFMDGRSKTRVMNTSKSMDEGSDISGVDLALVLSGTSSTRQDLQRTGRAIRFSEGKLAMIINVYLKGTQDEKWLKARQAKTLNVEYVDSIDSIKQIINRTKLELEL